PFSLSLSRLPPSPTLFPYTTLFRSLRRVLPRQHAAPDRDAQRLRTVHPGHRRPHPALAVRVPPRERTGQPAPPAGPGPLAPAQRSEEHTSELQSRFDLVCRLLLEKT